MPAHLPENTIPTTAVVESDDDFVEYIDTGFSNKSPPVTLLGGVVEGNSNLSTEVTITFADGSETIVSGTSSDNVNGLHYTRIPASKNVTSLSLGVYGSASIVHTLE